MVYVYNYTDIIFMTMRIKIMIHHFDVSLIN
jgi:hypothetical protein